MLNLAWGLKKEKKERGTITRVRLMEGGRLLMNERLRGATAIQLFFPFVLKADLIDFANLKHSHCRTFHRPIDWN